MIVGNTSEEDGGTGAGILTAADFQNAVLALLRLDSEIRAGDNYRKRQCDFWDYLLALKP